MACCLTAPSHYLNQCWLIIRGVLWHTSESSFAGIAQGIDSGYEFEKDILKNIFKSPRGQWVNPLQMHWSYHSLLLNHCVVVIFPTEIWSVIQSRQQLAQLGESQRGSPAVGDVTVYVEGRSDHGWTSPWWLPTWHSAQWAADCWQPLVSVLEFLLAVCIVVTLVVRVINIFSKHSVVTHDDLVPCGATRLFVVTLSTIGMKFVISYVNSLMSRVTKTAQSMANENQSTSGTIL